MLKEEADDKIYYRGGRSRSLALLMSPRSWAIFMRRHGLAHVICHLAAQCAGNRMR